MAINEPDLNAIEAGTKTEEIEPQLPARRTIGEALSEAPASGYSLVPQNFEQLMAYCAFISKSDLIPKEYRGKPSNVLIAVQMGAELGMSPQAALQSIAVINGRPSLWGDGFLGIIRTHKDFESCEEWLVGEGDGMVAHCRMIRKGQPPVERTFSVNNARLAGLWGKDSPWKTYPERMLQMRARSFTGRDLFPDALKGLAMAEEQMDVPAREKNVTPQSPGDVIDLDPENERDQKIVELLSSLKWTNARLEIEAQRVGGDKGELLARLEKEDARLAKAAETPGGPGDRSGRRVNAPAAASKPAPEAPAPQAEETSTHESEPVQSPLLAPLGDGTPVDDNVRKKLFATLNELGLEEKQKRYAWAFTFGLNVKSFTEIKGNNVWQFLADRATEQLVEFKKAKAPPPEDEFKNTSDKKCSNCGAMPGEKHVTFCPTAYSAPPRSGS